MKRLALGRGLEALIPTGGVSVDDTAVSAAGGINAIVEIPLDKIRPNQFQPRTVFDPARLAELAESIKERGVIQPILVRPADNGYEIIVGERRFRAVEKLGWSAVPALILEEADNEMVMEMALIENIQREDLNPIEEAAAYYRLITECNITQSDLAARIGKDRSSVANSVRLLSLPKKIQEMLMDGRISSGHARALLAVPADSDRIELAEKIISENLSVRDLEKLVYTDKPQKKPRKERLRSAQLSSIEESLKRKLGTKVILSQKRKGGRIVIEYYSVDELNRLLELFGVLENF